MRFTGRRYFLRTPQGQINKKPAPSPLERHMSRIVTECMADGRVIEHGLSIVEIERDSGGNIVSYRISPYERELPFTEFHSQPLALIEA